MNFSAEDLIGHNGTELGYSSSAGDGESFSEEGILPHVFDIFTVRVILCVLYSLVFIICVPGELSQCWQQAFRMLTPSPFVSSS